jgi:hypothetical protein
VFRALLQAEATNCLFVGHMLENLFHFRLNDTYYYVQKLWIFQNNVWHHILWHKMKLPAKAGRFVETFDVN